MNAAEFGQFLQEKGHIAVPCWLLEKHQALDISPEELGLLLLALFQQQKQQRQRSGGAAAEDTPYPESTSRESASRESASRESDPWTGRALDKGWAKWSGEGGERRAVFDPLWQKLYQLWEKEREAKAAEGPGAPAGKDGFDYSRIVKELDRLRGSLSVTFREQQFIQELNLKYGWSTEFILNFFRLCGSRNLIQMKNYKPVAAQIHRSGIYTLEGLTSFMNDLDWISRQVMEIKKDYLGLYGMVTVTERDLYVKWHVAWHFSHAIIVRAAEESAGASGAGFKYVDAILERWRGQGVDSLEACEEAVRTWKEEKKEQIKGGNGRRKSGGEGAGAVSSRRRAEKEEGPSLWSGFFAGEAGAEEGK